MSVIQAAIERPNVLDILKGYFVLTKPRINALLLFTAYSAAVVAAGGFPDWKTTVLLCVGLALSGGGAAALNMWYDRDIDTIMSRTQHRPLPQGLIPANHALTFALTLGVLSVPVVRGSRSTRRQCFVYSLILLIITVGLIITPEFGWLYAVPAGGMALAFVVINARLLREADERMTWARRTFIGSLMILPAVFGWMMIVTLRG